MTSRHNGPICDFLKKFQIQEVVFEGSSRPFSEKLLSKKWKLTEKTKS